MAHKLKFSWWSGNTQWGILTVLATIKQSDYCAQYESRYLLRWEHTGNTGAEELVKRRKIVNRVLYFHATPSIIRCGDIVALKAEGNVIKYGIVVTPDCDIEQRNTRYLEMVEMRSIDDPALKLNSTQKRDFLILRKYISE